MENKEKRHLQNLLDKTKSAFCDKEEDSKVWKAVIKNKNDEILKIISESKELSKSINNKPPDISDTAPPEDGTKDNVMEMSAEELSKFLGDIVANFRSKQGS